jgi:hypothetical protein
MLTYILPNRIRPVQCWLISFRIQVVSEQHNCSVNYSRTFWQDCHYTICPLKVLVVLLCVQEVPRSYLSLATLSWPRCSGCFISLIILVLYLKIHDATFLIFSNSWSIIVLLITATDAAWKVSVFPYFKLRVIFHFLKLGDFKSHIMIEKFAVCFSVHRRYT